MYRATDPKYQNRLIYTPSGEVLFRDHVGMMTDADAYSYTRKMTSDFTIDLDHVVPFRKESWTQEKKLVWCSNLSSANGYGMVAENTTLHLQKLGIDVYNPKSLSSEWNWGGEMVDESAKLSLNRIIYPDCLEIQHCQPLGFQNSITQRRWIYTMFETNKIPRMWVERLNKAEHVLVPSSWMVPLWKSQGVTPPIDVYHHGIDTNYFYDLNRPIRETFTFLHYCQLSSRKGTDVLLRAFEDEFKNEKPEDVHLILKNVHPFFPITHDEKIETISATYDRTQLQQLLFRADCFVFPTRGEGFGLTPFEAMASGLPTIVTDWSGPHDFIDQSDTLALHYTLKEADYSFKTIYKNDLAEGESIGEWAEPDYGHLRELMRWTYSNREKAQQMGKRAAERLKKYWTWEIQAQKLIQLIDKNI